MPTVIRQALSLPEDQFLGEPVGRDTLNAVGYSAAVIAGRDPEAVIAVFTADHIIEPLDEFLKIVEHGFQLGGATPGNAGDLWDRADAGRDRLRIFAIG